VRDLLQMRDAKLTRLEAFPLFARCSRRELIILGKLSDVVTFEAGSALQVEGSASRSWWLLSDGTAATNRAGVLTGLLAPGDFFGEASLLNKEPAAVTVMALTDVSAFVFDRSSFLSALHESPSFSIALLSAVTSRTPMEGQGDRRSKTAQATATDTTRGTIRLA
jgi:CRP-like cAMP-binding protein